jgi:hypothetical protein
MEMDDNANVQQQTFAQPMSSNQIQPMSSSTMINQQQQQQQMNANYGNNNFSMSNILGGSNNLSDIDPATLLLHASNIQITPIINASIDDLQILNNSSTALGDDESDIVLANHMHHNIAISSANN